MNKHSGFTLIELVIVIVILGVLAVTAAPKFINIQDDAKIAAAEGVLGAVKSASTAVHAKALVTSTSSGDLNVGSGVIVNITERYPTASAAGIAAAVELDGAWATSSAVSGASYVFSDGDCQIVYDNATSSAAPNISFTSSTCSN
jgi:MSHA pilin protein MshA